MPSSRISLFYQHKHIDCIIGSQHAKLMHAADRPLTQVSQSGSALLANDVQHSILLFRTPDKTLSFQYCPYGDSLISCNDASILGFNGERLDPFSGSYALGNGHRVFSTTLMRFNRADNLSPFGLGGINSYAYCQGDPVNRRDPSGRMDTLIFRAVLRFLTQGGKIAAPGALVAGFKSNSEFFNEVKRTTHHALSQGAVPPHEYPPERVFLMENANHSQRPINLSIIGVNRNLASWGDASLTTKQATHYVKATFSTNSNTFLFFNNAIGWLKQFGLTKQAGAFTGFLFNISGAIVAGALDHSVYKSGLIFRENPTVKNNSIRQVERPRNRTRG